MKSPEESVEFPKQVSGSGKRKKGRGKRKRMTLERRRFLSVRFCWSSSEKKGEKRSF